MAKVACRVFVVLENYAIFFGLLFTAANNRSAANALAITYCKLTQMNSIELQQQQQFSRATNGATATGCFIQFASVARQIKSTSILYIYSCCLSSNSTQPPIIRRFVGQIRYQFFTTITRTMNDHTTCVVNNTLTSHILFVYCIYAFKYTAQSLLIYRVYTQILWISRVYASH